MDKWNGVTLITDQDWMTEGHPLQPHTDASSSGYGAVCGRSWFHGQWTGNRRSWSREATANRDSMPFKELFAVVTAALTWGSQWGRKKVVFRVDCLPVVQAVQKGATRQRRMMQLLRALHHCAALHHFDYRIVHIAGVDNVIADEVVTCVLCVPAFSDLPAADRPFARHGCAASNPRVVDYARAYLSMAIGDSTRKTYSSGVRSYL